MQILLGFLIPRPLAAGSLITRDVSNRKKMGVRGIPKVFINGKILKKRSFEGFREMIEAELMNRKR